MSEDRIYTRCGWCHRWHPREFDDQLWLDSESQPEDKVPSDTICPACEAGFEEDTIKNEYKKFVGRFLGTAHMGNETD
jgi:hypothetical protein